LSHHQDIRYDYRIVIAITLAAFCMPFATGFLGIMPLDQSIIFEAAGRLQRGDRIFTDFGISYGCIPVLLQTLLFEITGINWFSYVLHAAIFNAAFALVIFDLLRLLIRDNRNIRIIATLMIAWAFYPMFGTAFLDNHSFFFGITAWWVVVRAFDSGKFHLLLWCGPLLVLGFYSKPLPALLWVAPVLFELTIHFRRIKNYVKWLTGSIVCGIVVATLPFIVFDSASFWYYTFQLPFYIGIDRMGASLPVRVMESMGEHFKIWIPTVAFLIFLILLYGIPRHRKEQMLLARLMVVLLVTIVGAGITANAFNNNTAPVFILVFFIAYTVYLRRNALINTRKIIRWITAAMITYYAFYISVYNLTRRVHDIYFTTGDLKNYSSVLGVYLKTENNLYTVANIDRLHQIVQSNKCLYIGDLFCIYSLSRQSNPWPISHLHNGTSYSSGDLKNYVQLKVSLLQNLQLANARFLIEDITWHKDEPLVEDLQLLKGRLTESFGNIRVFELDAGRLEQMLSALKSNDEK
jgi:hypothetical protein